MKKPPTPKPAYPNGGGIAAAKKKAQVAKGPSPKVISTSKQALVAKHNAEKAQFEEKFGTQDWSK
jgi:hypothetical protein